MPLHNVASTMEKHRVKLGFSIMCFQQRKNDIYLYTLPNLASRKGQIATEKPTLKEEPKKWLTSFEQSNVSSRNGVENCI